MVAGSEIKINAEGIFITTPKVFNVKAEMMEFLGGRASAYARITIFTQTLHTSLSFH